MVIDTSIFIEYLRAKNKTKTSLYSIPDNRQLYISSVTYYELLMGATDQKKEKDVALITEDLPILSFDELVASKSSEIYHILRSQNKMIGIRDIFIGATFLIYEMPIKNA